MELHMTEPIPISLSGYEEFLQAFEHSITISPKSGNISIALIDIDWFGQLNEKVGRPQGDAIIEELATLLSEIVGDLGRTFRYGGDAFMILFDGLEKEQAFLRVEESRIRFDGPHNVKMEGGTKTIDATISCGVAAFPDDGTKSNEVIRKCSEALYRAKISGRNKVSLAREEKMVTKTTHYTTGQLDGLQRLAKREGLNEATLLREALDDILRKYNS
jgi:diguanylate cyclase (GGDEF)-like protein